MTRALCLTECIGNIQCCPTVTSAWESGLRSFIILSIPQIPPFTDNFGLVVNAQWSWFNTGIPDGLHVLHDRTTPFHMIYFVRATDAVIVHFDAHQVGLLTWVNCLPWKTSIGDVSGRSADRRHYCVWVSMINNRPGPVRDTRYELTWPTELDHQNSASIWVRSSKKTSKVQNVKVRVKSTECRK